jgi:acyl-coenzyme A thioesterase 9
MIFGGYILRLTFELAFSCATRFSHSRPRFISLDSTTFDCPVPVGSILESEAMVVHTAPSSHATDFDPVTPEGETTRVQVRVKANVRDVHTGKKTTTGTFAYTFGVEGERRVLPTSYGEYMEWIIAQRYAFSIIDFRRIDRAASGWQSSIAQS